MIIYYNAKRFFNVTQFSTKCYPPQDLKAINFALTFGIVNLGIHFMYHMSQQLMLLFHYSTLLFADLPPSNYLNIILFSQKTTPLSFPWRLTNKSGRVSNKSGASSKRELFFFGINIWQCYIHRRTDLTGD